jgi:hypothetical protein
MVTKTGYPRNQGVRRFPDHWPLYEDGSHAQGPTNPAPASVDRRVYFTKQEITSGGPGGFISLYDYTDKDAVILFLLGYG